MIDFDNLDVECVDCCKKGYRKNHMCKCYMGRILTDDGQKLLDFLGHWLPYTPPINDLREDVCSLEREVAHLQ